MIDVSTAQRIREFLGDLDPAHPDTPGLRAYLKAYVGPTLWALTDYQTPGSNVQKLIRTDVSYANARVIKSRMAKRGILIGWRFRDAEHTRCDVYAIGVAASDD